MVKNKDKKDNAGKQKGKKIRVFKVVSIIAVILLLIVLLLPVIISSGPVTSIIKSKIAASADADVEIGNLKMGWRKGITLEAVSYADKNGIIVDAQTIHAKVNYFSLLGGDIIIPSSYIENATVTVVVDQNKPSDKIDDVEKAVSLFIPTMSSASAANETIKWVKFDYIRSIATDLKNVSVVLEVIDKQQARSNLVMSDINGKIRISPPGRTCGLEFDANMGGEDSPVKFYALAKRPELIFEKKEFDALVRTEGSNIELSKLSPLMLLADTDTRLEGNLAFDINATVEKGLITKSKAVVESDSIAFTLEADGNKIVMNDFSSLARITSDEKFLNIKELTAKCDWMDFVVDGQIPVSEEGVEELFTIESEATLHGKFNARLSKALEQFPHLLGRDDMKVTSGDITGNLSTSSVGGNKVFYGNISLSNFDAVSGEKDIRLTAPIALRVEIAAKPDGIMIDPIEINSVFMNLSCSGMIDDLRVHGVVPLKAAQRELSDIVDFGPYEYFGELVLNADLIPSSKILNGTAFLENFRVVHDDGSSIGDPYSDMSFGLKYDEIEKRLWMTSMFLKSSILGEFELLQGFFNFREDEPDRMVSMFKVRSDISKIVELMNVYEKKPEDFDAVGTFTTTMRVILGDDNIRISSEDTSLTEFKMSGAGGDYSTKSIRMAVNAELRPAEGLYKAQSLEFENQWAKMDFSKLAFELGEKQNSIETDFQLDYDLDKMSQIESFIPKGFTAMGKRQSKGTLSTVYDASDNSGIMKNLNAKLNFGFDGIRYMGLKFGVADIDVNIDSGTLDIPAFSVPLNGGKFNFAADADLKAEKIMLNIADNTKLIDNVSVNDDLSNGLLKFINPVFAGSVNSSGQVDLLSRKSAIPIAGAKINELIADAQVSVRDVKLKPAGFLGQILDLTGSGSKPVVSLDVQPTDINIADQRVAYDNMTVNMGSKPIGFSGSIGFAGDIQMDVTVPYAYSIGGKEQTRIVLPVDGNVGSPRIDTRKLLEKNTDQLNNAIDEVIEKNTDEETGKMIKEGIRGLQDLLNQGKKD